MMQLHRSCSAGILILDRTCSPPFSFQQVNASHLLDLRPRPILNIYLEKRTTRLVNGPTNSIILGELGSVLRQFMDSHEISDDEGGERVNIAIEQTPR